jgi:hypothetical protein
LEGKIKIHERLYGMLGTPKAKIEAKRLQSEENLTAWNSIFESRSKKENWGTPSQEWSQDKL